MDYHQDSACILVLLLPVIVSTFPWLHNPHQKTLLYDSVEVKILEEVYDLQNVSRNHVRNRRSADVMPSSLHFQIRFQTRELNLRVKRSTFGQIKDGKADVLDFPVFIIENGRIKRKELKHEPGIRMYSNESTGSSFIVRKRTNRPDFILNGVFYDGLDQLSLTTDANGGLHQIHKQNQVVDFRNDYINTVNSDTARLETHERSNHPLGKNHVINKRQANDVTQNEVKLFMIADNKDYRTWLKYYKHNATLTQMEMNLYYAFIANSINVRYSSIKNVDNSFSLDIIITGLLIVNSQDVSSWTENHVDPLTHLVDAARALESFRVWIKSARYDLPPSDHWMLFTGFDISTNGNRNVAGLAKLGGMCSQNSISLIEQDSTGSVGATAAHELGHSLSAIHDGEEKDCLDGDNYIMSRKLETPDGELLASRPWQFSPCSVRAFKRFISESKCTHKSVRGMSVLSTSLNPGQVFSADLQCQLALGNGSYFGRSVQLREGYPSLCRRLWCADPQDPGYYQGIFPLENTSCGRGKWCQKGKCVEDPLAPRMEDTCPQGDDPTAPCVLEDCPYYTNRIKLLYCCHTCRNIPSWLDLVPSEKEVVRQIHVSSDASLPRPEAHDLTEAQVESTPAPSGTTSPPYHPTSMSHELSYTTNYHLTTAIFGSQFDSQATPQAAPSSSLNPEDISLPINLDPPDAVPPAAHRSSHSYSSPGATMSFSAVTSSNTATTVSTTSSTVGYSPVVTTATTTSATSSTDIHSATSSPYVYTTTSKPKNKTSTITTVESVLSTSTLTTSAINQSNYNVTASTEDSQKLAIPYNISSLTATAAQTPSFGDITKLAMTKANDSYKTAHPNTNGVGARELNTDVLRRVSSPIQTERATVHATKSGKRVSENATTPIHPSLEESNKSSEAASSSEYSLRSRHLGDHRQRNKKPGREGVAVTKARQQQQRHLGSSRNISTSSNNSNTIEELDYSKSSNNNTTMRTVSSLLPVSLNASTTQLQSTDLINSQNASIGSTTDEHSQAPQNDSLAQSNSNKQAWDNVHQDVNNINLGKEPHAPSSPPLATTVEHSSLDKTVVDLSHTPKPLKATALSESGLPPENASTIHEQSVFNLLTPRQAYLLGHTSLPTTGAHKEAAGPSMRTFQTLPESIHTMTFPESIQAQLAALAAKMIDNHSGVNFLKQHFSSSTPPSDNINSMLLQKKEMPSTNSSTVPDIYQPVSRQKDGTAQKTQAISEFDFSLPVLVYTHNLLTPNGKSEPIRVSNNLLSQTSDIVPDIDRSQNRQGNDDSHFLNRISTLSRSPESVVLDKVSNRTPESNQVSGLTQLTNPNSIISTETVSLPSPIDQSGNGIHSSARVVGNGASSSDSWNSLTNTGSVHDNGQYLQLQVGREASTGFDFGLQDNIAPNNQINNYKFPINFNNIISNGPEKPLNSAGNIQSSDMLQQLIKDTSTQSTSRDQHASSVNSLLGNEASTQPSSSSISFLRLPSSFSVSSSPSSLSLSPLSSSSSSSSNKERSRCRFQCIYHWEPPVKHLLREIPQAFRQAQKSSPINHLTLTLYDVLRQATSNQGIAGLL